MTGRAYNPEEIRAVAGKVGGLSNDLSSAGSGLTGVSGGTPFGDLPSSAGMSSKLKSFTESMQKEFTAGAKLVTATAKSINDTARNMDSDEDDTARRFGGNRAH